MTDAFLCVTVRGMGTGYHILRVRTGTDFEVVERLVAIGVEALSIVVQSIKRHPRSKRKITRIYPLFAGYVFARVPAGMWRVVQRVKGVIAPLRSDGGTGYPETVGDEMVSNLQESSELGALVDPDVPVNPFKPGDRVTFDLFAQRLVAVVAAIRGNVVETTTEISGKRVKVTRVAEQFRMAA